MAKSMNGLEIWQSGTYKNLKASIKNYNAMNTVIRTFFKKFPLYSTLFIKGGYGKNHSPYIIKDIEKFIEVFNDSKNIKKKRIKQGSIEDWSMSAIDCLENCGDCENCFYNKYESISGCCNMKNYTEEALEKYGDPMPALKKLSLVELRELYATQ